MTSPEWLDLKARRYPRPPLLANRSVAVVHEWFSATGGSENVFLSIADLVPHAARYVLWAERDVAADGLNLRESWIAHTPLRRAKALALPFMPLVWRTLSRARFDVVISSSHAFAHTVMLGPPEETRYLSYVHSPARYLWSSAFDCRGSSPLLSIPRRTLQSLDVHMARHVHGYAVNSREVKARINRYWKRDAIVINPPVDIDFFSSPPASQRVQARDYLLGVGRWIPYKKFDLMIDIAAEARMPLVIAGSGPEETKLRRAAGNARVPVTFEIRPSRERLRELYWGALALLFPTHEDFGIVPVEAQASGTPVIGLRRGGLLETVIDGETGFLVDSTYPAAYAPIVHRLAELTRDKIQQNATKFSPHNFAARMAKWVEHESS
jgi:glycosyltransferase involved in cell wall biosynthesis